MGELLSEVEATIQTKRLFRRGQRILVAVSGGLDSMVLLRLLDQLSARHKWKLVVAHFNHRLRGKASDADERLVRRTARQLGWPVQCESAGVRQFARTRGLSLEMAARQLRHDFFARTAKQLAVRSVALAHHADDQVELFFLRVLRGTGGQGIAGMKWASPSPSDPSVRLVRPLIDQPKAALKFFAARLGLKYREDASNVSLDFARNRIRLKLLPLLREDFQPAVETTTLRLMEILGVESEFVEAAARRWLVAKERAPFAGLHVAVQRRCVQLELLRSGLAPDFDLIERLRLHPNQKVMASPHATVLWQADGFLCVDKITHANFDAGQAAVHFEGTWGKLAFDGLDISWQIVPFSASSLGPLKPRAGREFFDADKVGEDMVLRHWQPGDRFQPIGMAKPVKLQDFFTNHKIPRAQRHGLVLAATVAGEIFWIGGQRIGEKFKLDKGTRRCLSWQWRRV
ncbi:MAG: tRNA lysidine(34) synthetase TilS [Verrucomicrobia bacterium]|nr:tRNA lysidine(34) synthetase TilS [Verrucomicrobiota bacterium]